MDAFIYVFSQEDKDKLINLGYQLLKSDESNNMFVFANENRAVFSLDNIEYVESNILTF